MIGNVLRAESTGVIVNMSGICRHQQFNANIQMAISQADFDKIVDQAYEAKLERGNNKHILFLSLYIYLFIFLSCTST